ncbi:MAG: C40 family peptidase [Bacteroidetes bacterium]|nr:C40 family peptidase [Bacteroidota bacterium]
MTKSLFILSIIILVAASCSSVKPVTASASSQQRTNKESQVTFIDNISVTPGSNSNTSTNESSSAKTNYKIENKEEIHNSSIEKYSPLQFKYAILTNSPVEQLRNEKLVNFMDEWYGTKYHYGGTSKSGIDCSAFVSMLMASVYGITSIPRTARDQYEWSKRIDIDELQQGDLVFFHTMTKKKKAVSHVGVYLCNNKFVHASVSGVMISDMNEGYYAKHYVGAGRVYGAAEVKR